MLKLRPKISEKKAKKMIFTFVRYGDHSNRAKTDILNNKQIELSFEQHGYNFKKLVTDARNWDGFTIPFFENLLTSTSYFHGGEAKVINERTGDVLAQAEGSGIIIRSDYEAKFESALKHKKLAIENQDIEEYYSCLSKAFSSIESYFYDKSNTYNYSSKTKLVDTKESPSDLESKFKNWVPILTNGNRLDLSRSSWMLLLKHLKIRHDMAIHPKNISQGISYDNFAILLNEFRDGIAQIFFELQVLLGDKIKRSLIREIYSPDIYVELDTSI